MFLQNYIGGSFSLVGVWRSRVARYAIRQFGLTRLFISSIRATTPESHTRQFGEGMDDEVAGGRWFKSIHPDHSLSRVTL